MSWCALPDSPHKRHKISATFVAEGWEESVLSPDVNGIILSYLCLVEYFWFDARYQLMMYFHGVSWSQWVKNSRPPSVIPCIWTDSHIEAWRKSFDYNPKIVLWNRKNTTDIEELAESILARWNLEKGIGNAYRLNRGSHCPVFGDFNYLQNENWSKEERIIYELRYHPNLVDPKLHQCLSNNMKSDREIVVHRKYKRDKVVSVVNPLTMPLVSAIICVRGNDPPSLSPATIISFD
jgi:hypothetical protein